MSEYGKLLSGQAVLIADDEPFNLSIVARMLREMGCNDIMTAADGREALRGIQKHQWPFSFIILDFNMPAVNGLQILKLIRTGKTAAARGARVFMLTGSSDFDLVGAAMALDVDAFLVKPISWSILAARVEKTSQHAHDLKDVFAYESVKVDEVSQRLSGQKPPEPAPPTPPAARKSAGIRIKLDDTPDRAILAEEIRAPTGEVLLEKATVLTPRLIRRLVELSPVIRLDYINIFPPRDESHQS